MTKQNHRDQSEIIKNLQQERAHLKQTIHYEHNLNDELKMKLDVAEQALMKNREAMNQQQTEIQKVEQLKEDRDRRLDKLRSEIQEITTQM